MEAMLGIAVDSYPYPTSKNAVFLLFFMFTLQQNWRKGQNRFCLEERWMWGEGEGSGQGLEMAQTKYAHMNT
jgi:hypothetical protein